MILTNTRFRRRPSRLPGQLFRLALKDPLPGAKGSGEQSETIQSAVGHRHLPLVAHDLPLYFGVGIPVTSFRTGVLAAVAMAVLARRLAEDSVSARRRDRGEHRTNHFL